MRMIRLLRGFICLPVPDAKKPPQNADVVHMYVRVIDELLLEIEDLREQLKTPFD
jgi:hypothetical protein